MDDSILQILKANQTAKNKVKETLASHADDIQKLQEKKAAIELTQFNETHIKKEYLVFGLMLYDN